MGKLWRRHKAYFGKMFIISDVTIICEKVYGSPHAKEFIHIIFSCEKAGVWCRVWMYKRKVSRDLSFGNTQGIPITTIQCEMCIFLFLTGERGKGTKQDELLQIFINKVNIYVLWEREPSAIYQSYIHLRKNLLSWNKLGIYPIFLLPVLGPSPTKEDVWGYGVAINMVSK